MPAHLGRRRPVPPIILQVHDLAPYKNGSESAAFTDYETITKVLQVRVGYEILIFDVNNPTVLLAVLSNWNSLQFMVAVSDLGVGRVTLDYYNDIFYTEYADHILTEENIWVVQLDGVPRFAFLAEEHDEAWLAEGGTKAFVVAGRGVGCQLEWGTVLPPWYPTNPIQMITAVSTTTVGPTIYARPVTSAPHGLAAGDEVLIANTVGATGVNGTWIVDSIISATEFSFVVTAAPGTWESGGTVQKTLNHIFLNTAPMTAWLALLNEAKARGACTAITQTFTAALDSDGNAWDPSLDLDLKVGSGSNLLELLPRFVAAQNMEWCIGLDLVLNVAPQIGNDVTSTVRFFVSSDQLSRSLKRSRKSIRNVAYVDDSKNPNVSVATDATSITQWGRREVYSKVQTSASETANTAIAQNIVDQNKDETRSITFKVGSRVGRQEFVDYNPGDSVYLDTDEEEQTGVFRVMAISVQVDADQKVDVELTTVGTFARRLEALAAQFSRLTGQDQSLTKSQL